MKCKLKKNEFNSYQVTTEAYNIFNEIGIFPNEEDWLREAIISNVIECVDEYIFCNDNLVGYNDWIVRESGGIIFVVNDATFRAVFEEDKEWKV